MLSRPSATLALAFATATALFAPSTSAASAPVNLQQAIVTIESSHGGAGNGLSNTTVHIPLSSAYTNETVLDSVSYLYLVGSAGGVPLDSITCTPFRFANATGMEGCSFNSSVPSLLSTNTVSLGSILCTTNTIAEHPPLASVSGSATPRPAAVSASASTTLTVKWTSSAAAGLTSSAHHTTVTSGVALGASSTVTSLVVPKTTVSSAANGGGKAGSNGSPASISSSSTSASAPPMSSQTDTSGGRMLCSSSEFFSGLALAGLGLAFVL